MQSVERGREVEEKYEDSDYADEDAPSETYEPTYLRPKEDIQISDDEDDEDDRDGTYQDLPSMPQGQ